jgi:hypothetical protein
MVTKNNTGSTYTYPNAPSVVQPADVLNLHPGPNNERSIVRWSSPSSGTYAVSGRFEGIDTDGTTTDVLITKNGTTLFTGVINGYGNQLPFSLPVTVAAGDILEFSVGYGANGSYNGDSTGLAVTITDGGAGGGSSEAIHWLVTDHLGTPRMIIDQSGTLATIKRHDYLPFGEELFAPAGGRSAANGYGCPPGQQGCVGDGVRQQFTQKERDVETGLDYSWLDTTHQFKAGLPALMNSKEVLTSFGFLAIPPPEKNRLFLSETLGFHSPLTSSSIVLITPLSSLTQVGTTHFTLRIRIRAKPQLSSQSTLLGHQ